MRLSGFGISPFFRALTFFSAQILLCVLPDFKNSEKKEQHG